jgi:hypothetical protein
VRVGDVVAEIRGLDGRVLAALPSPADGWVGVHVTYGHVEAGADVAMLFARAAAA